MSSPVFAAFVLLKSGRLYTLYLVSGTQSGSLISSHSFRSSCGLHKSFEQNGFFSAGKVLSLSGI